MMPTRSNRLPRVISGSGGGGGKGGGSRGRAPVESANTLRSRATARVIDLIGEGENVGLVDGAKSIKFDNTRLQNDDGSYNFSGVTWAERTGTPSQDFLPGFGEVLSEQSVGVELLNEFTKVAVDTIVTNAVPVVQTFSATANTVTVEIRFPRGLSKPDPLIPYRYDSYYTRGIATSVAYAIDLKSGVGAYTQVASETVTQLTKAEIVRSYTFTLPGAAPWSIRVRRLTADSPATYTDEMRFFSYSYTNSVPAVRTLSDSNLTAARVSVRLPNGLFEQSTTTGDVNNSNVELAIDLKQNGGQFQEMLRDNIVGKTTTPYEKAYRIELPAGTGPWDIRVRRLTASNQGINVTNALTWASLTSIVDSKIRYVDSHVLGIAVDAEAFGGSVPVRSYHIKGRIIQVPVNYDPVTRIYTGVWNGTFKLAWSDNPAWCFYDMVMHTRYGLGEFLTDGGLKWDLYPIGQYCDVLVPDGKGGMEPRYTFNGGFQTADEAIRVIQAMASVFRGMAYWASGGIGVSADMPADPVKIVAPSNVIRGDISLSGTALKARHTVAFVQWNDPDDGYRLNIEVVEDIDAIDRFGWRPAGVVAIGCSSQGQANRVGRWLLDSEMGSTQAVTYAASWDHADVQPGEIISVSDPAFSGIRRAGRISNVNTTSQIVIDEAVVLSPAIAYTLTVVLPDMTLEEKAITNPPGTTAIINLASPLSAAPLENALWAITGNDVAPRPFRVLGVKETEKHTFEVIGIFHDETKYARVELNLKIEPPSYTTIITGALLPPSNIHTNEYLFLSGGVNVRAAVTVSWTAPKDPRVQFYEVQSRDDVTEWQSKATTQSISVDLPDFGTGVFDFRVRSLDGLGHPSDWVEYLNVSILGLQAPPDDVTDFNISVLNDVATLTWSPVTNLNLSHYTIRFSPDIGASWQTSLTLLDNISTTSVQVPAMVGTYAIKAETLQGIRSVNESLIYNEVTNFTKLNAVTSLVEQPTFAGTQVNVINNPTYSGVQLDYASDFFAAPDFFTYTDFFLAGDGFFAEGTQYFATQVDLGDIYTSRLSALVEAFGLNFGSDFFEAPDLFALSDFFLVESDKWDVQLQFRATSDDPAGAPVWTPWTPFVIGDYTARAYEFRAVLASIENNLTPVVTRLEVSIDMPDRIISQEDLVVTVAGRRIDFLPPYRALTGVSISAQGLTTGDYYEIINKDNFGFDIIFKDAAAAPVERTLDYVAVGYGKIQ